MYPGTTFLTVFKRPIYLALGICITVSVLILAIWLPNIRFISDTIVSNHLTWIEKWSILFSSLGAFKTNFTFASQIVTLIVSVLTGINVSLLIYHVRQSLKLQASTGSGVLGTLAGLAGIGCASCGSVILSSIFGLTATSGFIGVLPFKGVEFGIAGILILIWANGKLLNKIARPGVCTIPNR